MVTRLTLQDKSPLRMMFVLEHTRCITRQQETCIGPDIHFSVILLAETLLFTRVNIVYLFTRVNKCIVKV